MESAITQVRTKPTPICVASVVLLLASLYVQPVAAKTIKIGVAQTVIEARLEQNQEKLCDFIDQAKRQNCQVVIFPEGALYWSDVAAHEPTQAELDAAMAQIGRKAASENIYVVFGIGYRQTSQGRYHNRGAVYDPDGHRVLFYQKNAQVPCHFTVQGVPFNLVICSDRGYLEHSDLPCLVQGSQAIIDISGGHGGDDGRPDLRWIRYRPWALRTGAFVIVCNPVHDNTDFMGHSPWGGGSAVIQPDGSIQASRTYERDALIVTEIDASMATRSAAQRRRHHLLFKPFWDMGAKLLKGEGTDPVPEIRPLSSAVRDVKIAAAQIVCSREMDRNTDKIARCIQRAATQGADIVVFPELAVTGCNEADVRAASHAQLNSVLRRIQWEAHKQKICVIVGMPWMLDGHRMNCAFVIGDDGSTRTRYAQMSVERGGLFQPGTSAKAMWFELKGVHAIVTIGDDANWVEIADLAASRGMVLHFHITAEACATTDAAILAQQRNLLILSYAQYGAVVNAAMPMDRSKPDTQHGGMSMIVSREGGHNKPAPKGLTYYLPYQTSIVKQAGQTETMIVAERRTAPTNSLDLNRNWRSRNRKNRTQSAWYEWIKQGAWLCASDALVQAQTAQAR